MLLDEEARQKLLERFGGTPAALRATNVKSQTMQRLNIPTSPIGTVSAPASSPGTSNLDGAVSAPDVGSIQPPPTQNVGQPPPATPAVQQPPPPTAQPAPVGGSRGAIIGEQMVDAAAPAIQAAQDALPPPEPLRNGITAGEAINEANGRNGPTVPGAQEIADRIAAESDIAALAQQALVNLLQRPRDTADEEAQIREAAQRQLAMQLGDSRARFGSAGMGMSGALQAQQADLRLQAQDRMLDDIFGRRDRARDEYMRSVGMGLGEDRLRDQIAREDARETALLDMMRDFFGEQGNDVSETSSPPNDPTAPTHSAGVGMPTQAATTIQNGWTPGSISTDGTQQQWYNEATGEIVSLPIGETP